jgi:hypothetical protein
MWGWPPRNGHVGMAASAVQASAERGASQARIQPNCNQRFYTELERYLRNCPKREPPTKEAD